MPISRSVTDVDELTRRVDLTNPFPSYYVLELKHLTWLQSGARIALAIAMDYEKMKALLEASREESAVQHDPEVKEFPKPESRPDWKYLAAVAKDRMAA